VRPLWPAQRPYGRRSPGLETNSQEGIVMAKKTTCPITRSQFKASAKPIAVTIGDQKFDAEVKEFSTGSLGWNINGKITVEVGGIRVPVQVGMNLTVVGSKELPPEDGAGAPTA
jgi:hypothetical protein